MRKSIFISLLAGVALPLSAYAQDSGTTPPAGGETTPPAASDTTTPQPTDTAPASDSGAGAAGGSDAGTMSDTPDSGSSAGSMGSSGAADSSSTAPADGAAAPADSAATDSAASSDSTMADSGPLVTVPPTGAWRVTDLDGKDVYDTQGESIGEITDVLVSEDGKVIAVLVGVGGFLGIGEKNVAVSMSALEFGPGKTEGLKTEEEANAAASASSGTAGGTGMAGGTAGGAAPAPAASAEPQEPVVGDDNLPDRIVLNVSREQLENAPAYGEPEGEDDAADGAAAPTDPAAGDASQPATAPAN